MIMLVTRESTLEKISSSKFKEKKGNSRYMELFQTKITSLNKFQLLLPIKESTRELTRYILNQRLAQWRNSSTRQNQVLSLMLTQLKTPSYKILQRRKKHIQLRDRSIVKSKLKRIKAYPLANANNKFRKLHVPLKILRNKYLKTK